MSEPRVISQQLRIIANKIEISKNPVKELVVNDLKSVISSLHISKESNSLEVIVSTLESVLKELDKSKSDRSKSAFVGESQRFIKKAISLLKESNL